MIAPNQIIQGDCLQALAELPQASVDLLLTDPPYTISRPTGFTNTKLAKYATLSMEFGEWDKQELDLTALATAFFRVVKPHGTVIVFYDFWKLTYLAEALTQAGFKVLRHLIWQKTNPVPINTRAGYLSNSREYALSAVKQGKATFNSFYDTGIYEHGIPTNKVHPTQKPIKLFVELVEKHSNPGDLVLDPFCGSGTTCVAAKQLGRNYIGIDASADAIKLSRRRLKAVN